MKFEKEAKKIIELVGGDSNINSLVHCATRLRFELKDGDKFKKEELEKLNYVLKVVMSGGQYQVVIGPAVDDYYESILQVANIKGSNQNRNDNEDKWMDRLLKIISGAFSPLIPLLAGSGMIKALLTLFIELQWLGYEDPTYLILSAAGNACFYFLPIFLGITLSKQFKVNQFVGGAIGAALLEPNFTGLVTVGSASFLGIEVTPIAYGATIFPIFIAVFVYSFLEKGLKKFIPQSLQLFLIPMICLMIMVPFTVIVFGPFGTTIGNSVSDFVMWLFSLSGTLAGIVLGATYPFLTMLGLHWGFTPITLQNLEMFGGDIIEGACVCAVWAQIGVAAGAFLKSKKQSKLKAVAGSTVITGFFAGVTEPILYSIIMKYKRLMAVVAIAGGLGGAVAGTLGVTMDAYVFHNIFSIAVQSYSPLLQFVLAISISCIAGILLTYFWGLNGIEDDDLKEGSAIQNSLEESTTAINVNELIDIKSPLNGEVIELKDVKDEVFASGVAGKGIAIIPENGEVISPVDGTVTVLFPSKHAIGITTKEGVEILIHIGLNTVMLNGEGFESYVKQGDKVVCGDKLLSFDKEMIQGKGYSLQSPVLVTNADNFKDIIIEDVKTIKVKEIVFKISA